MNKPLVIVLVIVLVGLAAWKICAPAVDTAPDMAVSTGRPPSGFMRDIGGVKTDEEPEFDVQLEAKMDGNKSVLEFTITETHGWGVKTVLIRFWHRIKNEETGEWIKDPNFHTNAFICNKPLEIGKPLVYRTVLAEVELDQVPDGLIGTSEEWGAKVEGHGSVYKPAD
ncbi:MAG: hypothetical protein ACE5GE_01910 [Phycisphaerae bacterium]